MLGEGVIEELYHLENGAYDDLFGSVELRAPAGEAQAFVVAGAGKGIPCYRALQRRSIPFATGILYENDVDFRVARQLSRQVISVPAFHNMEKCLGGGYPAEMQLGPGCGDTGWAAEPLGETAGQFG